MTSYPTSQDNDITLPNVSGNDDQDIAIKALRDAVFAIEKELGSLPSGAYLDVRARFDILEGRISPGSSNISNDGYVNSPLILVNNPNSVSIGISVGNGAPTNSDNNGSLYIRADGYVEEGLYVRRSGVWKQIFTNPWAASGDLSGDYLNQKVVGIQTYDVSNAAPSDGYTFVWSSTSSQWQPKSLRTKIVRSFPSDADYTAIQSDYQSQIMEFTGTISVTRQVIVPLFSGYQWTIYNNTTGGQAITIIGTTGTGVTIGNGTRAIVYADGTNVVRVTPDT